MVNSLHHQAVDKVADNFKIIALSDDGNVEAIQSDKFKMFGIQ